MSSKSLEEQLNILADEQTKGYVKSVLTCDVSNYISKEGRLFLLSYLSQDERISGIYKILQQDLFNQIRDERR